MIRNRKKTSDGLPPPFVSTGCMKGGGTANPLTTYVQLRTFHLSPSLRHRMLSSTVADTNLQLISNTKLTAFMLWPSMNGHFWGYIFLGGIFPSKIGHIAPFLATIQRLSKTCAFLLSKKKQRLLYMGRTSTANRGNN
jgi:hypothetical protein